MIYMHENNIKEKIEQKKDGNGKSVNGYKNLRPYIEEFYKNTYKPFQKKIKKLTFNNSPDNRENFDIAANLFWEYYCKTRQFASKHKIDQRSKFSSSFLEEISTYLFRELDEIKTKKFGVYNKGIYAGLKIDNSLAVSVIPKDVDFCIGRKTKIKIGKKSEDIIFPIVAVEVKTYLDATMFGEVQFTSDKLRAAAPYVKSYVLMVYKDVKDDHIIAARANSSLNEMFVLKKDKIPKNHIPKETDADKFSGEALFQYWLEISTAIHSALSDIEISTPGKLFEQ